MDFDVTIIGSGPAGAVLAYHLASAGLGVLIVEKEKLPRYKPCGGGLTQKTIDILPVDVSPVYELNYVGGVLNYAGKEYIRVNFERPVAILVMRDRFDHYLVEQAKKNGVKLSENTRFNGFTYKSDLINIQTSNGDFLSRLLVGADGVNSPVAHHSGLIQNRLVGAAIEAELGVSDEDYRKQGPYAVFDFGALKGGYGWIFPKKKHLSVGVFSANTRKVPDLKGLLARYIAMNPVLKNNTPLHVQGHRIPLDGVKQKLNNNRILLVGDAANLADPWLGEGIYHAVKSANLAARVITRYFDGLENGLDRYTELINQHIVSDLQHARRLSKPVYFSPEFGTKLFSRSPFLQELVFGVMRGDLTFEKFNKKILFGLPLIFTQALRSNK